MNATDLVWDAGGADPPHGTFNVLGNWNDNTQFPTAGDMANFDLNDAYTVTFTANAASDALTVSAGIINFRSNSATVRRYDVTTGAADMGVYGGGILSIGATSSPVVVNVGDSLDVGVGGNGQITVSGASSAFNVLGDGEHIVALTGNIGQLIYTFSAQGTIAGSVLLGSSSFGATRGNLYVQSGADLDVGNLRVGTFPTSSATGTVTVTGAGSTLDMMGASTLDIGGGASGNFGILNVDADGTFNTGTGNVTVNRRGAINIGGGRLNLNGDTTVNGGTISGSIDGTLFLASGRTLTAQNGAQIDLGSAPGGFTVSAGGTTWNINSGADVFDLRSLGLGTFHGPAAVTVDGAGSTLRVDGPPGQLVVNEASLLAVTNSGTIDAAAVIVSPGGEIRGDGTIVVSYFDPCGIAFEGCVHNGGLVSPGSSIGILHIDGNYRQDNLGALLIELTSPGSFDSLDVTGFIDLDGTLDVSLIGGYSPLPGHSFDILDWGDTLSGTFATLNLPALAAGLSWDTSQLYTTGVLFVLPALEADFDEDGDVDGDDLAEWRAGFGTSGAAVHMDGDADGDADVDGADFLTWQRQLGSGLPAVSAVESVPEPCVLALISVVGCGLAMVRQWRR